MRVKIGGTWYDAKDTPIMLVLDAEEIEDIRRMPEDEHHYSCVSPSVLQWDAFVKWCTQGVNEQKAWEALYAAE